MKFLDLLLPDAEILQLDGWKLSANSASIQLQLCAVSANASCPVCNQVSQGIHSHYQRNLMDLPVTGYPLKIQLQVRKFFCTNVACERKIFCERLPSVARAWGRRTERLRHIQQTIGLSIGGAPGHRLSQELKMPAGVDLLLALARDTELPKVEPLSYIGVDDWAQRKGCRYGTIIVDLKRSVIVDILPDRDAETVAKWLRKHPTIHVVSRDRAASYAQAIHQSLPAAKQVADRWHLLKNMTDTLFKILQQHDRHIKMCFTKLHTGEESQPVSKDERLLTADQPTRSEIRRQKRVAVVKKLHEQGMAQKDIALKLGCHPKTVSRDLAGFTAVYSYRSKRSSILDPFKAYLLQ